MAKINFGMRLVGATLGRMSVATQPTARIVKSQQRTVPHNPIIDLLLGGVASGVTTRDATARGADGQIAIRVYRPTAAAGTLPLVVLMHGGGWISGDLNTHDWLASEVARGADAVVVSLAYRLAPTHRWPVAAEDCYAALCDVAARAAEWQADASRLAVMGDSAGGNLAAVAALMARDRSGPALAYQALIYPATDLTMASPSIDENAHAPILTKTDMVAYTAHYTDPEQRRDPYASPLLAPDHAGLPPALVQVAEHDPLRDDGLRYAAALQAAGVPVTVSCHEGKTHGFYAFPRVSHAADALAELCDSLRAGLHAA